MLLIFLTFSFRLFLSLFLLAENSYISLYFELGQLIFPISFSKKWLGCLSDFVITLTLLKS